MGFPDDETKKWEDFINKVRNEGLEYTINNYPYNGNDSTMIEMQKQFRNLFNKIEIHPRY